MKTAAFSSHPYARTDLTMHFELSIEDWLRWSANRCTLYPVYDERWRDAHSNYPAADELNLVAAVRRALLPTLAGRGFLYWSHASWIPECTYRAIAELVAAGYAEDTDDENGGLRLIVKPAGLDAAAKLPRDC
jgi:hypothetical protein